MRTYYFVGGPRAGGEETFFAQLQAVGGAPGGWRIYPHASPDGRALHLVEAESEAPILAHLAQFGPIYERGPIVEVVRRDPPAATSEVPIQRSADGPREADGHE